MGIAWPNPPSCRGCILRHRAPPPPLQRGLGVWAIPSVCVGDRASADSPAGPASQLEPSRGGCCCSACLRVGRSQRGPRGESLPPIPTPQTPHCAVLPPFLHCIPSSHLLPIGPLASLPTTSFTVERVHHIGRGGSGSTRKYYAGSGIYFRSTGIYSGSTGICSGSTRIYSARSGIYPASTVLDRALDQLCPAIGSTDLQRITEAYEEEQERVEAEVPSFPLRWIRLPQPVIPLDSRRRGTRPLLRRCISAWSGSSLPPPPPLCLCPFPPPPAPATILPVSICSHRAPCPLL